MKTKHTLVVGESKNMKELSSNSVNLTITSPPYPMIEMWDSIVPLNEENPKETFNKWHTLLNEVWKDVLRVTKDGGYICINIGDATRTINKNFSIYPNHVKIIEFFMNQDNVSVLPSIIWWKPTNAPNKFMGSGMLPVGAYVTLEHEHILVFRKGNKREFGSDDDKLKRRNSSFFWEERNEWFSDSWTFKGVSQGIKNANRERSAAFPFELPFRLINMYSLVGDVVLDTFLGTGTTTLASIALGRSSVGYDIDSSFHPLVIQRINENLETLKLVNFNRMNNHNKFVEDRKNDTNKNPIKHFNKVYNIPVMTSQETEIRFPFLSDINVNEEKLIVEAIYNNL